jgi:hypothetical protein
MADLAHLILRAEALLDRLADYLPASDAAIDWGSARPRTSTCRATSTQNTACGYL